jgi:hypothetical protein
MDNISKLAFNEASKKINLNLSNQNTIFEITITNNVVYLTRPLVDIPDVFISRQNQFVQFVTECCQLLDEPINLIINIGTHDAYKCDLGIMVFSLESSNEKNILIPDLYSMDEYGGKLSTKDEFVFESKKDKAIFAGSTTGNLNPKYNERLQLCNKYIKHNNIKCYISNFVQINMDEMKIDCPNYNYFASNNISIEEQLKYKYIINVDGNTCAWDRIPWILNSNSLLLKKKSTRKCWYYDLLIKNEHYIEFDDDAEIEHIINTISPSECNRIIKNANKFCKDYLKKISHMTYMSKILYYLSKKDENVEKI